MSSNNSIAIDIYYGLFEYYKEEEPIINALLYLIKRNRKVRNRPSIRKSLSELSLAKYLPYLQEMERMNDIELNSFRLEEYAKMDYLILRLDNLLIHRHQINPKKLEEVITLCRKLKQI